jgi:hypothetical protein
MGATATSNGRTGGRVLTVNTPEKEEQKVDANETTSKTASGMPEITLAQIEQLRDGLLKCKTLDDVQAWWKASFGTFGHKRLGRLLVNPNGDLSKLVRAGS